MITCPPVAILTQFLEDSLPPEDTALVQVHLEQCPPCQRQLETLVAGKQSWEDAARNLNTQAEETREPGLERAVQALAGEGETGQETLGAVSGQRENLPFLQPSSKPGSLGRLGSYEILSELGRGGMGIVLKAEDENLRRVVAIKVLAPQFSTNGSARKRFKREAQAAAAICHENVVTIHGVDESQGTPYLVMQLVGGVTLQEQLDRTGPLELKEVLRIGYQVACGLTAAHKQGLVHRDIKPANILLENGVQRVKITDFGLARAVDDASITQSGVIAGTPMFMAPEQAVGEAVDHRADLFSLGSVLYTMCTGRPPFRASGVHAVLRRVIDDTPRPIRELNPEAPEWLEAIIARLMAKKPEDRLQSAQEVAELLAGHLAHLQEPAGVPRPKPVAAPAGVPAGNEPSESTWRGLVTGSLYGVAVFASCFLVAYGVLYVYADGDAMGPAFRFLAPAGVAAALGGTALALAWYAHQRGWGRMKQVTLFPGEILMLVALGFVLAWVREGQATRTNPSPQPVVESEKGSEDKTVPFPRGAFRSVPGKGREELSLRFDADGQYYLAREGVAQVRGRYQVKGAEIILWDEDGLWTELGPEKKGKYAWKHQDEALTFSLIDDPVAFRSAGLIAAPFVPSAFPEIPAHLVRILEFPHGYFQRRGKAEEETRFRFEPDGDYEILLGGIVAMQGKYQVKGPYITLEDRAGLMSALGKGTFSWVFNGKELSFRGGDDPNKNRQELLTNWPLERVEEEVGFVFPFGTYFLNERASLVLDGSRVYTLLRDGKPVEEGTFQLRGREIQFIRAKEAGREEGERAGHYVWAYEGAEKKLTFTRLKDESPERSLFFLGNAFRYQGKGPGPLPPEEEGFLTFKDLPPDVQLWMDKEKIQVREDETPLGKERGLLIQEISYGKQLLGARLVDWADSGPKGPGKPADPGKSTDPAEALPRGLVKANARRVPTTYYHRGGPLGVALEPFNWSEKPWHWAADEFHADARLPASVVGLAVGEGLTLSPLPGAGALLQTWSEPPLAVVGVMGAGTVAAYARPYQFVDFFEPSPALIHLSRPRDGSEPTFTFVKDALARGANVRIFNGPHRKTFAEQGPEAFYRFVIVEPGRTNERPSTNLLSLEALTIFAAKCREDGVILVHTSNRHIHLGRVVSAAGAKLGWASALGHDQLPMRHSRYFMYQSNWALLVREEGRLTALLREPVYQEYRGDGRQAVPYRDLLTDFGRFPHREPYWSRPAPGGEVLTDDRPEVLEDYRIEREPPGPPRGKVKSPVGK